MSLLLTADQHALFFSRDDDCSTAPKIKDVCLADISRRHVCDYTEKSTHVYDYILFIVI